MKRARALLAVLAVAATALVATPADAADHEVVVTVAPGEALERDGRPPGSFPRPQESTGVFVASIPSPVDHDVAFRATTRNGSAVATFDYKFFTRSIKIRAGETQVNIPFTVLGDFIVEGNETFTLVLSDPGPGVSFAANDMVGTIIDDDTAAMLTIDDVQVTEGGAAIRAAGGGRGKGKARTVRVAVRANALLSDDAIVSWRTVDGTAKAGEHYEATQGSFRFRKNELFHVVKIKLAEFDKEPEPDRDFQVEITGVAGPVGVADAIATVTIVDDDHIPTIVVGDDVEVSEGDGVASIRIRLDHPSEKVIRISVGSRDGTARGRWRGQQPRDYRHVAGGLLKLFPGTIEATVTVAITDDDEVEGDEFFLIGVSSPETPNRALGPTRNEVRVTIIDDD